MSIIICGAVFAILATTGVFSISSVLGDIGMQNLTQLTEIPILQPLSTPTPALPYKVLQSFGEKGDGPGQLSDARWVAVDREGHIFAADFQSGRVTMFDAQGKFLRAFEPPPDKNDLTTVKDIAIDPNGLLAVIRTSEVLFYNTASGEIAKRYTVKFPSPWYEAIAFGVTGRTFVLYDTPSLAGLAELDANGKTLWKKDDITRSLHKKTEGMYVEDLAVDGSHNIYLMDSQHANIFIFDDKGEYTDRFGSEGDQPGQLDRPASILMNKQGQIVILDGNAISIFDRQGSFIRRIPRFWQGWLSDITLDEQGHIVGISNQPQIYVVELLSQ